MPLEIMGICWLVPTYDKLAFPFGCQKWLFLLGWRLSWFSSFQLHQTPSLITSVGGTYTEDVFVDQCASIWLTCDNTDPHSCITSNRRGWLVAPNVNKGPQSILGLHILSPKGFCLINLYLSTPKKSLQLVETMFSHVLLPPSQLFNNSRMLGFWSDQVIFVDWQY